MNKKNLAIIFSLILVFLGFFFYFTQINKIRLGIKELPTPTPTPIVSIEASPSAWANDKVILKIEKDLGILEKDLDTVDLDELPLRPPVLDLKVEY